MSQTNAVFIHSGEVEKYHYPPDCPFNTDRAGKTRKILLSMGLLSAPLRREVAPVPAERDVLETFHTRRYLDVLQKASRGDLDVEALYMGLGTPDCPVFPGVYEYAALACGGTLVAADLIGADKVTVAFNPSGGYHHAHRAAAAGFCYINDVVLGCMRLAAAGKRICLLDVDVHHCDGVQEAFYERSDVMTISFHESGKTLFPGTGFEDEIGRGDGAGYSINVPLPAGRDDEAYLHAFGAIAPPLIGAYDPDVIVLELGMDCLSGDPLAHLDLTNNAYAGVIRNVLRFDKPILAVGGGGYNIENTARGWALAWSILCGGPGRRTDDLLVEPGGVMKQPADRPGVRCRREVDPAIRATIENVKANVFSYHGLCS